jgi:hypothetical protein
MLFRELWQLSLGSLLASQPTTIKISRLTQSTWGFRIRICFIKHLTKVSSFCFHFQPHIYLLIALSVSLICDKLKLECCVKVCNKTPVCFCFDRRREQKPFLMVLKKIISTKIKQESFFSMFRGRFYFNPTNWEIEFKNVE